MKAVQINTYGGIDVLEINENTPKPNLAKNQLLVEVYAASINPIDYKIRAGFLKEMMPLQFPATLGGDFAGVILELGEGVTDLKVGDSVYGSAIVLNGGSGAFAENLAANTGNTALKPKNVDFAQAAALPLVGASAIQALEDYIKLKNGQKILITGGAGGIGTIAIQLAKSLGAYVATTVGSKDIEYVKSLGADEVIDYQAQIFEQVLKDFDAVFDTVGGETSDKSFQVLKKGGVIVSMFGAPNAELAQKYGVTAIGQNTVTSTQALNRLAELVMNGKIKIHIDKVFPLEEAKEAFEHLEEGHPQGKVVLQVKDL
ncbi:NADP-dependent oxidoreductase [Candidatus Daviesbacteria bacterium]|nr:NADP-dependent oxidoreductase [Candidatus Daviesbacteria bacterium]